MTTRPRTARRRAPKSPAPASVPAPTGGFPLAGTDLVHPPLGFGIWALGRWTREDEDRTRATLDHALSRGVRWVDTAEVYGNGRSERLLGNALAAMDPAAPPPFISTKVSWEHLRPSQVRASLLGSLQRLGRRQVDLYLVHAPDPQTPIPETMGALETLWEEKRTRSIGVSNFSLEELDSAREALDTTKVVVNQVRYNLLEREDAEPILDYCRQHGILIEAYTPLGRGLLAGRYLNGGPIPAEVRRFAPSIFEKEHLPETLRRARALRDLAVKAGVPEESIALHWLARQGVVPLFGASRPEQVDAVLAAWAVRPPDDVLDRADEIGRTGP
ncbi:MAG TPA: aldo/keto reductase [Thermoplasmata archaeon]|nr:aldo/keto reductase [Thermoplasmata archaeon]